MNIKNAKDTLARARGHISSAVAWLEEEEARPKFESITTKELMDEIRRRSKKGYFQAETKQKTKPNDSYMEWLERVIENVAAKHEVPREEYWTEPRLRKIIREEIERYYMTKA